MNTSEQLLFPVLERLEMYDAEYKAKWPVLKCAVPGCEKQAVGDVRVELPLNPNLKDRKFPMGFRRFSLCKVHFERERQNGP